jgi:hypothetical protein
VVLVTVLAPALESFCPRLGAKRVAQ